MVRFGIAKADSTNFVGFINQGVFALKGLNIKMNETIKNLEAELALAKFEYGCECIFIKAMNEYFQNSMNNDEIIKNTPIFIRDMTSKMIELLEEYKK